MSKHSEADLKVLSNRVCENANKIILISNVGNVIDEEILQSMKNHKLSPIQPVPSADEPTANDTSNIDINEFDQLMHAVDELQTEIDTVFIKPKKKATKNATTSLSQTTINTNGFDLDASRLKILEKIVNWKKSKLNCAPITDLIAEDFDVVKSLVDNIQMVSELYEQLKSFKSLATSNRANINPELVLLLENLNEVFSSFFLYLFRQRPLII